MDIKISSGGGPDSDINVTPLIDIVLVMLIIFMVMTPIQIEEMAVNLPEKTEVVQTDDMPKDQLVVAVYDDGLIALNKRYMDMTELSEQLNKRLKFKRRGARVVFLDAHPDVIYKDVIVVMDVIRDAGADKVALARMKEDGPIRPPEAGLEGAEGVTAPPAEG